MESRRDRRVKRYRMRRVVGSLPLVGAVGSSMRLAVSATAGTGGGGGAFEGNKNGVENKTDTFQCTNDYTLVSEFAFTGASAYDLNEDGYVCYKLPSDSTEPSFVDDISGRVS